MLVIRNSVTICFLVKRFVGTTRRMFTLHLIHCGRTYTMRTMSARWDAISHLNVSPFNATDIQPKSIRGFKTHTHTLTAEKGLQEIPIHLPRDDRGASRDDAGLPPAAFLSDGNILEDIVRLDGHCLRMFEPTHSNLHN